MQHRELAPIGASANDAVDRFERVVTGLVDDLGNLGVLVAINVDGIGKLTLTAGHSNLDKSRAVHPGDVFAIGSQTKTITAMILFLLARGGRVDLDNSVQEYVDLPIDQRITVRHLLMNTSGLGEYSFSLFASRYDPLVEYVPRDLVAMALPQGQIFEPGDRFDYSNTGWVVAAMVIEAVTGKSYGAAAAEYIVDPLGLKRTGFGGIIPDGERLLCYMTAPTAPEPVETSTLLSMALGAGDGLCSADDILAIYQSLLRPDSPLGITLDDLVKDTAKPSRRPNHPLSLGTEYGLGLERRAYAGSEVWGHPGSIGACRTSTWIDAGRSVGVTTALTCHIADDSWDDNIRHPRAQLFSMALNTAYALACDRD